MDPPTVAELRRVLEHYDLGELVEYEKNDRGFVNTAYAICTVAAGERRRYFLRKYKPGIQEEELIFEHSLIEHVAAAGSPVARIHHTRSGKSYLQVLDEADGASSVYYTVFDYLPGEDQFTWINPVLTEQQLAASARVLAQFHIDAAGFTPLGRRLEPKILELLPVIAETWSSCPARSKGTVVDARIGEAMGAVRANIAATLAALQEPAARSLPKMVIHCDYHPGNLKFTGDQVTGVFDFDWSKVDLRLFDLGLALWYFCTSWQGTEDGSLRLDWSRTFLRSYQETLRAGSNAWALIPAEAHYLPAMINAGNLYILHWTILDFFAKDVDPAEYLVFLDHSLNFTRWYNQPSNLRVLEAMVTSVLLPTA
jgi:homoserine kinase type II